MAHTDACKFQVCQLVEKLVVKGESVNAACKVAQTESDGIPAETIRRWWKDIQNEAQGLVKNDQRPKLSQAEIYDMVVDVHNKKNVPYTAAIKEVASQTGKRRATIRKAFDDEERRQLAKTGGCQALDAARYAIGQLERITKYDNARHAAFTKVREWMDAREAEWK